MFITLHSLLIHSYILMSLGFWLQCWLSLIAAMVAFVVSYYAVKQFPPMTERVGEAETPAAETWYYA